MYKTLTAGLLACLIVIGVLTPSVHAFEDKPKKEKSSKESKDKFSKIKKGMSMEKVRDILGDPNIESEGDDGVFWFYDANKFERSVKDSIAGRAMTSIPFVGSQVYDATNKGTGNKMVTYRYLFKNGKVVKISKSTSKS